jgi:hypothetical protein
VPTCISFLTQNPVEYHLHKVFPGLGISFRRELPGPEHATVPS